LLQANPQNVCTQPSTPTAHTIFAVTGCTQTVL